MYFKTPHTVFLPRRSHSNSTLSGYVFHRVNARPFVFSKTQIVVGTEVQRMQTFARKPKELVKFNKSYNSFFEIIKKSLINYY